MKNLFKICFVSISCLFLLSCNHKPDAPLCVSPENGAKNITDSALTLSWTCFDADGDKLVFDVFLSESEDGIITDDNKIVSGTESSSCIVKNLKDNTVYFWQVGATDPTGRFSLNAWSFTTGIIEK